jgi:hypothetical protein
MFAVDRDFPYEVVLRRSLRLHETSHYRTYSDPFTESLGPNDSYDFQNVPILMLGHNYPLINAPFECVRQVVEPLGKGNCRKLAISFALMLMVGCGTRRRGKIEIITPIPVLAPILPSSSGIPYSHETLQLYLPGVRLCWAGCAG